MVAKKKRKEKAEEKPVRLDLACGQNKRDGFMGVDKVKGKGVDFEVDLFKFPWPFKDDSVDEIHCSHFIEHVQDIIGFMEECWRILKVDAQMTVIAPYYANMRSMQDPTHVRPISEATFFYYNQGWLKQNKLDHYGIKANFDFNYGYDFDPMWAARSEEARSFALRHYINVAHDIHVVLFKRAMNATA